MSDMTRNLNPLRGMARPAGWHGMTLLARQAWVKDQGLAEDSIEAFDVLARAGEVPAIPDEERAESLAAIEEERQDAILSRLSSSSSFATDGAPVFWWNR